MTESNRSIHRRHDTPRELGHKENALVTVGYTVLPRDIVQGFIPQHEASQLLPQRHQYLASPEYLRQHIYWAVPPEMATYKKLVSNESGRTLEGVLGGDFVPFADSLIGTNIDQKGVFRSGGLYQREDSDMLLQVNTPYGFVDTSHVEIVRKNTNLLLSNGFRSTLFLGGAILDKQKLLNWMSRQGYPPLILLKATKDILSTKNDLATFWRMGGVSTRWEEGILGVPDSEARLISRTELEKNHRRNSYARAARIFLEECIRFPNKTKKYLSSASDFEKTKEAFMQIAQRRQVSVPMFELFQRYIAGMMTHNIDSLVRLGRGTKVKRLGSLVVLGDLDLSMYVYDLEMTELIPNNRLWNSFPENLAISYQERIMKSLDLRLIRDFETLFGLPMYIKKVITSETQDKIQQIYHPVSTFFKKLRN